MHNSTHFTALTAIITARHVYLGIGGAGTEGGEYQTRLWVGVIMEQKRMLRAEKQPKSSS